MDLVSLPPALSWLAFIVALAFCVPAIFIRRLRRVSGKVLNGCTWVWTFNIWIWSCAVVLAKWGTFWLILGIFFFAGTVPMALVCFLFSKDWVSLASFVFLLILTAFSKNLAFRMMGY